MHLPTLLTLTLLALTTTALPIPECYPAGSTFKAYPLSDSYEAAAKAKPRPGPPRARSALAVAKPPIKLASVEAAKPPARVTRDHHPGGKPHKPIVGNSIVEVEEDASVQMPKTQWYGGMGGGV
ncbi:hypothetical protein BJ508DRAFT_364567 [Ascobolus immersus RN42]|uniref:Uncharacterized protein n=1 Tax=Ascobolus immersus RN42 TaxID=1160509 RepID=A0A3N4I5W9_ASCIM|nr:hypothetical protein BJ508DRAFT_364567 [Ascobolus immersus RN42]